MTDHNIPPDPYAAGVATLRAASNAPESEFEQRYRLERLDAMWDAFYDTHNPDTNEHRDLCPEARLTAAELKEYSAPDPYAAGLNALKEAK